MPRSTCAQCGMDLPTTDSGLCRHHHMGYEDNWAQANKIMCDFFHRGVVPERIPETREEETWWIE